MAPSDEVNQATGEAPSAAELLAVKRVELAQAAAALAAAEMAYDVPRAVQLQNEVEVLRRFVEQLTAKAAVEAAAAAKVEAGELHERLQRRYAEGLAELEPNLKTAAKAIQAAGKAARDSTTSWAAAARLLFEIRVLEMRFNLGTVDLDVLPIAPVEALMEMFTEVAERSARQSVRQPLPVFSSSASDSPQQLAVNRMIAAHRDVTTMAKDLKLSPELVALFAKAGAPEPPHRTVSQADPAYVGTSPLPPGSWQGALGPTSAPPLPETAEEKAEREETRRSNTRHQADVMRQNAEEAARLAREDELIRAGKLKAPLDQGMRG